MFKVNVFGLLLSWLWLTIVTLTTTTAAATPNSTTAKPGCPTSCGNLTVPYPFGIGLDGACSIGFWHNIRCDTSFNPPKPFYGTTNIEVVDISETHFRIKNNVASKCYQGGVMKNASDYRYTNMALTPFEFSHTANTFTAVGCDDFGIFNGTGSEDFTYTGCVAACSNPEHVLSHNGSCSGVGCCQTFVPKGLDFVVARLGTALSHLSVSEFNPCGYAFIGDKDKYTFNVADLSDPTFRDRINNDVPIVVEWAVNSDQTCQQAQQNLTGYACQQNSNCTNSDISSGGYRCSCKPGYEGNPYLPPGCTDIDECSSPSNPCSNKCINTPGSFICTCPERHRGDGRKNGTGCTIKSQLVTWLALGVSFGFLFLLILVSWIYFTIRRKKLKEKREKVFRENGGLLLEELLPRNEKPTEASKIFSAKELRIATKNYSSKVLGEGGFGKVYKGVLKDGRHVAIKKSTLADNTDDESRIHEFINEVVILIQVKHHNVVKLIGCCLETEVPLLVYEFISNGTLNKHICNKDEGTSWLNWENSVRVATEAANALAYLHSEFSTPIIHRDVKSTNILVDDQNVAKIADFGASRPKTIADAKLVHTAGYLDPEAYHTSKLTQKSDVYSFGVVLAELLTKEKAVFSIGRKVGEGYFSYLAGYFVKVNKSGHLMEIVDPQLKEEATEEQLVSMANIVMKCLKRTGDERPTMMEVARALGRLQSPNPNSHPWDDEQNYEEITRLVLDDREQGDLYSVSSSYSVHNETSSSVHKFD